MMIEIKDVVYIILAIITIIGGVVTFFVMQERQNMKIKQLEEKFEKLEEKQSKSTGHQIETEKILEVIGTKLDRLLVDMEELKAKGCGRCSDKT